MGGEPFTKIIDATRLEEEHRNLLRPGELCEGRPLPRYFYQVESWEQAKGAQLAKNFTLAELLTVDVREAPLLLKYYPHFFPCALLVFARYLQEFRDRVNAPVYIAANGGYRSPAHLAQGSGSPHAWGTAANIYRIGDTRLDTSKAIERYARIAESIGPEVRTKPYGPRPGETTDHLHVDIGYVTVAP
jgi:hypothetical protein